MEIKAKADDIELTLIWGQPIRCIVKDTAYDISPTAGQTQEFALDPDQAAATMALFIAGDMSDPELNTKLYELAEQVWKGVPSEFRPIP